MKTINIFNTEVVIFIIVLIVSILFISFYNIVKPEDKLGYNFSPYARFSPKDLPDNNLNVETKSCYNTLTACDDDNQCPSCDSDEFTCTEAGTDGQYIFQNQSVPAGQWCLPKNNNQELCGTYTGNWTWVNDEGYCSNVNTFSQDNKNSSQCWKCIPRYPNLYGGRDSAQKIQPKSKIVATKEAELATNGAIKEGTIWDPNPESVNFNLEILRYDPYTTDSNGKPYFKYQCDPGYLNLPNDPFRCHPDFCAQKLVDSEIGPVSLLKQDPQGNYYCACSEAGQDVIPEGDLKGKCFNPPQDACNSWNINNKTCDNCNADPGCSGNVCDSKQCKSRFINQDSTLPDCRNLNNPVGYECVQTCPNFKCNYMDDSSVQHLSIDRTKSPPGCACNCVFAKVQPPFKFALGDIYCSNPCLPSGTLIERTYSSWVPGKAGASTRYYDVSQCCTRAPNTVGIGDGTETYCA